MVHGGRVFPARNQKNEQKLGVSDFYDNFGLFTVSLAYGIFVSTVGGGIGRWLARKPGPGPALALPAGHI